jgi:hypothetical protein
VQPLTWAPDFRCIDAAMTADKKSSISFGIAKARLTHEKPNLGENRKVLVEIAFRHVALFGEPTSPKNPIAHSKQSTMSRLLIDTGIALVMALTPALAADPANFLT